MYNTSWWILNCSYRYTNVLNSQYNESLFINWRLFIINYGQRSRIRQLLRIMPYISELYDHIPAINCKSNTFLIWNIIWYSYIWYSWLSFLIKNHWPKVTEGRLVMVLNNISKICSINSHHMGLHIWILSIWVQGIFIISKGLTNIYTII